MERRSPTLAGRGARTRADGKGAAREGEKSCRLDFEASGADHLSRLPSLKGRENAWRPASVSRRTGSAVTQCVRRYPLASIHLVERHEAISAGWTYRRMFLHVGG